ncbi:MAG: M48 family metalloprotease [Actinomycetota bacterium]|nr:M48 family metalloprotease [Actinomycetota bacterium]
MTPPGTVQGGRSSSRLVSWEGRTAASVQLGRRAAVVGVASGARLPSDEPWWATAGSVPMVAALALGVLSGALAGSVLVGTCVVVMLWAAGWLLLRSRVDDLCLWSLGATAAPEGSQARARNLVEGLCLSMGLMEPNLCVVDQPSPVVGAFGGGSGPGYVVISRDLERSCTRLEMEALLAHCLAHLRLGHGRAASQRAASIGLVALVWPGAQAAGRNGRRAAYEWQADLLAVATTRFPPALHSALSVLGASPVEATGERREALAGHCLCNGTCGGDAGLAGRIESLSDL